MYRFKGGILQVVNNAPVKLLKINVKKKITEVGIRLRIAAEHNFEMEMEARITPRKKFQ